MDRQFPPEIVQLIVEASIDPSQHFTFFPTPCSSILRRFTVLNSTWRGASEPLLYRRINLASQSAAFRLLDTIRTRGGTLGGVRELGFTADVNGRTVASILRAIPFVVHLALGNVLLDVNDFAPLQHLRQLDMCVGDVEGFSHSSTLSLPSLRGMFLLGATIRPSAAHFLTPACLPNLRQLELNQANLPASIASLAPQLESISVEPVEDYYSLVGGAPQLLRISSGEMGGGLAILGHLSRFPPFLFLEVEDDPCELVSVEQALFAALEQIVEGEKEGLRVILLQAPKSAYDEAVQELIKMLEDRGIRVEREGTRAFSMAVERMEKILAEEKREEVEREAERASMRTGGV